MAEMQSMGSSYKSKKKREYRRRKRKHPRMGHTGSDDRTLITEAAMSKGPIFVNKTEETSLGPSQEQKFHLIGNFEQPINDDYDEISSQCSSSVSDIGAEIDAAGLWRPEDDLEMPCSFPSAVSSVIFSIKYILIVEAKYKTGRINTHKSFIFLIFMPSTSFNCRTNGSIKSLFMIEVI